MSEQLRIIDGACCCAVNCKSNHRKNPNLHFFTFPSQIERCNIWIKNTRSQFLFDRMKTKKFHHKTYKLCSEHFEVSQFSDPKRTRLNRNAVPTLFNIPHPPKRIKQSRMQAKQKRISSTKKNSVPKTSVKSTGTVNLKNPILNAEEKYNISETIADSTGYALMKTPTSHTNEKISVAKSTDIQSVDPLSNSDQISSVHETTDINSTERLFLLSVIANAKKKLYVPQSSHNICSTKTLLKQNAISKAKPMAVPVSTELDSIGRVVIKYALENNEENLSSESTDFTGRTSTELDSTGKVVFRYALQNNEEKLSPKSTEFTGSGKSLLKLPKERASESATDYDSCTVNSSGKSLLKLSTERVSESTTDSDSCAVKDYGKLLKLSIERVSESSTDSDSCAVKGSDKSLLKLSTERPSESTTDCDSMDKDYGKLLKLSIERVSESSTDSDSCAVKDSDKSIKLSVDRASESTTDHIYSYSVKGTVNAENNEEIHQKKLNIKTSRLINLKKRLKAKHEQLRRLRKRNETLKRREKEQIINNNGEKFTKKEKAFAIGLKEINSFAYHYCQSRFSLPSIRSIARWKHDKELYDEAIESFKGNDTINDFICDTFTRSDDS